MRALESARTAPVRMSARLHTAGTATDSAAGMASAEYAVATVAACGFGGILWKVLSSPAVQSLLKAVIAKAFHLSF